MVWKVSKVVQHPAGCEGASKLRGAGADQIDALTWFLDHYGLRVATHLHDHTTLRTFDSVRDDPLAGPLAPAGGLLMSALSTRTSPASPGPVEATAITSLLPEPGYGSTCLSARSRRMGWRASARPISTNVGAGTISCTTSINATIADT
jgi:hypothetical protein